MSSVIVCCVCVGVLSKYLEYLGLLHASNGLDYTTFIIHINGSVARDAAQIQVDHKMRLTVNYSLLLCTFIVYTCI